MSNRSPGERSDTRDLPPKMTAPRLSLRSPDLRAAYLKQAETSPGFPELPGISCSAVRAGLAVVNVLE